MDATDLARKITPHTRAVIIQHTFGIPAEMGSLQHAAQQAGIPLIEDCCHTLASVYKGQPCGTFGAASFFSFEWGKPLVAGLGGSAVINAQSLRDKVQTDYAFFVEPNALVQWKIQLQYLAYTALYTPSLYWTIRRVFHQLAALGAIKGNYNPVSTTGHVAQDFAFKMSPSVKLRLQHKMSQPERLTTHSIQVSSAYKRLIHSAGVSHPAIPPSCDAVFARYPLLTASKSELLYKAQVARIEVGAWYATPVHPLKESEWPLVQYARGSCPNAELRAKQVITLPTHAKVTQHDIHQIADFLNEMER